MNNNKTLLYTEKNNKVAQYHPFHHQTWVTANKTNYESLRFTIIDELSYMI